MRRRDFLKSTLAAGVAANLGVFPPSSSAPATTPGSTLPRRPYKDGVELSILGCGGIVVMGNSHEGAAKLVAEAVDAGVNYFDVAPSYGDGEAEVTLGTALEPFREKVFLACKTLRRDAGGAEEELHRSLDRLHTDRFDLYQFHAVTSRDDVEAIFAPAGALEAFLDARRKGLIRFIGFSAHSETAALAMMERFPFDSLLFPVNVVCYHRGNFGPRVLAEAKRRNVARLALKALAHTPWPPDADRPYPKCWYKPVDDPEAARSTLRFTLSEDVTAAIPPGDERLFRLALRLAKEFTPLTPEERELVLASTEGLEPLFTSP